MKKSYWLSYFVKRSVAVGLSIAFTLAMASYAQKDGANASDTYRPGHSVEDDIKRAEKAAAYPTSTSSPIGPGVAPTNDNFVDAPMYTGGVALVETNLGATGEAGEPVHGAGNGGSGAENNSVWYKLVAPISGVYTITTTNVGAGSLSDTVLSAYTGASVNALNVLAENDDYPGMDWYSRITFGAIAGQTYYIAVDGYGAATGQFGLTAQITSGPANDAFANAMSLDGAVYSPFIGITGSNLGATSEVGEPSHYPQGVDNSINSIWYKWTAGSSRSVTISTAGSNFDTVLAVYTGSAVNALTPVARNDDYGTTNATESSQVTFFATAGTTYRIAIDGYNNTGGNVLLNWYPNRHESGRRFDFNGDRKTDISIFRPSNGQWWITKPNSAPFATTFGATGDRPVPGDYTGDGKSDIAVWRPSNGHWYVLRSDDYSFYSFPFGTSGDIPMAGRGNLINPAAGHFIFRPSTGTFYHKLANSNDPIVAQFGSPGDIPVVADYNGDGSADMAIYRPSNGQWWIWQSGGNMMAVTFGAFGDKPVPGDYTGDGRADVALYRQLTGEWFVLRTGEWSYFAVPFGTVGDIPAPGDYDGDGLFDQAVFRPSNGTWYVNRSGGASPIIQQFGSAGDRPVANSYIP